MRAGLRDVNGGRTCDQQTFTPRQPHLPMYEKTTATVTVVFCSIV